MLDVILRRFEQPDEVREFEKGRFEVIRIGGLTIGRATYQPGWKWSVHVGPIAGTELCEVAVAVRAAWFGRQVAKCRQGARPVVPAGPLRVASDRRS